ncbi:hypothetical protein H5410_051996 [Solanum commersonii]|uniref:Uncharacterized protein n=1 Tax=Solanum commersonii TaxID=4109 RepID=A0A9J5WZN7_SOLCO|nr:hypothetical protein H5410_051996 [Solanum commersonii]
MHYETDEGLKPEFIDGDKDFIEHTMTLIFSRIMDWLVMVHLYRNGFKPRYFVWIDHGERDGLNGKRNGAHSLCTGSFQEDSCEEETNESDLDVGWRKRPNELL